MNKNNINEISKLNEELTYKNKLTFLNRANEVKNTKKVKQLIFDYSKRINSIEDQKIAKELSYTIKQLVSNQEINFATSEDIKLLKNYKFFREVKSIKTKLDFPEKSNKMKALYQQELEALEIELPKLQAKKDKLEHKTSNISKGIKRNLEIKIAKLKIRKKDLNSFIKNRSILKKVYISDEPPLTTTGWIKLIMSYGMMLLWALIILWPVGELVRATLNAKATTYLNTNEYQFGFNSFTRLFNETDFISWMTNTIIVAGITSISTIVLALLMGYAFSRFRFKGKRASLMSVMLLQMIPALAALTVFYVLYSILNQNFNISGSVVLILIYIGGGVAGNTFIMKGYMDSISMEIDEAARIDGLSQWRIFTRIIVPLTKPMIALVGLWSFIGPFGDFILPGLLLTESKNYTLARGLQTLASDPKNIDQGAFAAGAVLVAVPISLVFIGFRRFLVGGITSGGVKG